MARLRKTLADYIVIGISPALIIALVSSLMLFLVEVFYRGGFQLRISAIIVLFVLAATLIARISIEEGREYAAWFAVPLAFVLWLAVGRFTNFGSIIGMALIAAIWWCADKLTWDCTVIDDGEDASGEGLLQTVGMDQGASQPDAAADALEATSSREEPEVRSWWQRYLDYRRRPHAPGVWVVYFSLAALPLFGIGQRFIPSTELDSRRYAFKLLCVYVVCALGLLLTTSFLGLRRYLRQRRIEMPVEMAGTWLAVGAAMIFALLALCTLLPRPHAEYSITHMRFESPDNLRVSRWGMPWEGAEDEEEQAAAAAESEHDAENPQAGGAKEGGEGSGAESGESSGESDGEGQQSGGSQEGEQGGGDNGQKQKQGGKKGKSKKGEREQRGDQDSQSDDSSENATDDQGELSESGDSSQDDQSNEDDQSGSQQNKGRQSGRDSSESPQGSQNSQSSQSRPRPSSNFNPLQQLANLGLDGLKWLYYLAFFLLAGYLVWRYREQVSEALRNFFQAIQEFWARLLGGREQSPSEAEDAIAPSGPRHQPFAAYTNPFLGSQPRMGPRELVQYTFQALEAWARERNCARQSEQTPHEFAQQLNQADPAIARNARSLADLYCRAAYSQRKLSSQQLQPLAALWQTMTTPQETGKRQS